MKKSLFIFITIISVVYPKSEMIALCLSAEGPILRNGSVRNGAVRKGDSIFDGDKLIVSESGYLVLLMVYDKAKVNIYEKSVIKLFNDNLDRTMQSRIELFGGKVIVQMEKNNQKTILINSPSTASMAVDAHFLAEYREDIIFDNITYTMFNLIDGKMELKNIVSDKYFIIKKGETIISTRDGKFFPLDSFRNQSLIANTLENFSN